MSVRTMARVWAHSQHGGTHLLMLLALADFSDDDGNAYPAVSTLAEKCRMKPRNAQVLLAALRDSGELQIRPNEGPNGTNRYRIVLTDQGMQSLAGGGVQNTAGVQSLAGVQANARGGAKACAKGVQGIAPEPSLNHQEPSEKRARRASSKPEVTFSEWIAATKAKGEKPISQADPINAYAEKAKLGAGFLELAWLVFKDRFLDSQKTYADWRATFRNYVKNDYLKLWRADHASGQFVLTTAGVQAAQAHGLNHLLGRTDDDVFGGAH